MGDSTVLIVTDTPDLHADAVTSVLARDYQLRTMTISTGDMPEREATFRSGGSRTRRRIGDVDLGDIRCVWWRRASPSRLPKSLQPADDDFRKAEFDEFAQGLLWSLETFWVNHPGAERVASRKLVQLSAAQDVGLDTPNTLITNDPAEALAFYRSADGPVVYKRTGTGTNQFVPTRLLEEEDLPRLSAIRYSPTTFQSYVEAEADLRVVWVAGQPWAVRIDSQAGEGWLDSRLDNSVSFTPWVVDELVLEKLRRLMDTLGLVFGVLDFRISSSGELVFLEVNPQGQFAYLEVKTGMPICADVAELLARPEKRLTRRGMYAGMSSSPSFGVSDD